MKKKIVIVAFGTRGDIQPLMKIAVFFSKNKYKVTFITHSDFKYFFDHNTDITFVPFNAKNKKFNDHHTVILKDLKPNTMLYTDISLLLSPTMSEKKNSS